MARLASIPHGTSFVAQGSAFPPINGKPDIASASITPFTIAPPHDPVQFSEVNLGTPSAFRTPPADIPNVARAMVNNPSVVPVNAIATQNITSITTLWVSMTVLNPPTSGGGTANIAFLQGTADGPNALDAAVDAIFWIETIKEADGKTRLQLQYSQRVLLNFNKLS